VHCNQVIDRSGGWMLNWQRGYRALDIAHLRSPEGLHPGMCMIRTEDSMSGAVVGESQSPAIVVSLIRALPSDPYDHSALAVYAKHVKLETKGFVPMTQLGRGKSSHPRHGGRQGHGAREGGTWYHGAPPPPPPPPPLAGLCGCLARADGVGGAAWLPRFVP
jgi:hypothetical protein